MDVISDPLYGATVFAAYVFAVCYATAKHYTRKVEYLEREVAWLRDWGGPVRRALRRAGAHTFATRCKELERWNRPGA